MRMSKRINLIRWYMVSGLQDLFRKCRKNVGYTCKYPALFVPLLPIYKQKTYV